jgi:glycosyltransferase involved in cell wall biosynthesis
MQPVISIITPCYGSPKALGELLQRTTATMAKIGVPFEMILVDDRCPMDSWSVIMKLARESDNVVGVRLSRNFGQHPAIYAGLSIAKGEWIVVMDCDLQDQPEEIESMYRHALTGYDAVRGRRSQRQDNFLRRLVSERFYAVLTFLTGVKHSAEIANFGIYHRKVIDGILSWNEDHRYFPAAVQWIGFNVSDISVAHATRKHGKSAYNFSKLLRLALSIIVSFSDKPLRMMVQAGVVIAILSFVISVAYLAVALAGGFEVPGWASIMISLWFMSGCLIFAIGFVGIYVGQVMREAKGRPNYVVDVVLRKKG